jgi:YfiH family protein
MTLIMQSKLLLAHGFAHGFSTRLGGVSEPPFDALNLGRNLGDAPQAVETNHARLAEAIGYDLARLAEVSQVHGTRCVAFEEPFASLTFRQQEADAVFATAARDAVGVRTADCTPVLIGCLATRAVLAIHAGWRGTVDGVIPQALKAFSAQTRGRLVAAIGPHIRAASFEVGEDVAMRIDQAARLAGLEASVIVRLPGSKPHADLTRLVIAQLMQCGLAHDDIDDVGGDTFADATRFFSHRRDASRSGRHLSVIVAG